MVTGAYHPEISGASLQCRQLVKALEQQVDFLVLTTTTDRALPAQDEVDGVEVHRVYVDPRRASSKTAAAWRLWSAFVRLRHRFDILHVHGFSQKTLLLIALARAFRKRVIIKLTSVGHDDALSMRSRGRVAFWFYAAADRFIAVSPRFEEAHRAAGLPGDAFRLIPNGVDLSRFRPASATERATIRESLRLPADNLLVLFVGFFSHEKRPDLLYHVWARLASGGLRSTLVLIGATQSPYHEIDLQMAASIRADAARRGLTSHVVFVEHTNQIEEYYRAADVFALPTLREGLPNVLLEAMACGVPPVITRIEGVTDWMVDDGVTGILVPPNDEDALAAALAKLLTNEGWRTELGVAARDSVARRFPFDRTAELTLQLYREAAEASVPDTQHATARD